MRKGSIERTEPPYTEPSAWAFRTALVDRKKDSVGPSKVHRSPFRTQLEPLAVLGIPQDFILPQNNYLHIATLSTKQARQPSHNKSPKYKITVRQGVPITTQGFSKTPRINEPAEGKFSLREF